MALELKKREMHTKATQLLDNMVCIYGLEQTVKLFDIMLPALKKYQDSRAKSEAREKKNRKTNIWK